MPSAICKHNPIELITLQGKQPWHTLIQWMLIITTCNYYCQKGNLVRFFPFYDCVLHFQINTIWYRLSSQVATEKSKSVVGLIISVARLLPIIQAGHVSTAARFQVVLAKWCMYGTMRKVAISERPVQRGGVLFTTWLSRRSPVSLEMESCSGDLCRATDGESVETPILLLSILARYRCR